MATGLTYNGENAGEFVRVQTSTERQRVVRAAMSEAHGKKTADENAEQSP